MDLTLNRLRHPPRFSGPVVVAVMDGVGIGCRDEGDAVAQARTPVLDRLAARGPAFYRSLKAHGTAVGLPSDADMGNSEVGHNALGAGRIFDQGAKRINDAIASGEIFRSPVWEELVGRCASRGAPLHLIGLLSDGNVHSHQDHLFALVAAADGAGVRTVRVHALLDGRDVPETSALTYVDALEATLDAVRRRGDRDYRIASGGGRMVVTMDRYGADWDMVRRGWDTHVRGAGRGFPSAREAIETLRAENPGIADQYLPPFVIADGEGRPVGPIRDGASVVLFNFRGDRAVEICRAFEDGDFPHFDRSPRPDVLFAGMMQYDGDLRIPGRFLVAPPAIDRTLGCYLSAAGIRQFACSETQKFGHVTYFWNGNNSDPLPGETFVEVPSDTRPFEERPWMKAAEVTDAVVDALRTGTYRFARLNYPNGDMVGHTGKLLPAVLAVEAVDLQLGRLVEAVTALDGVLIVTADHGNADDMFERDRSGRPELDPATGRPKPRTSHTLNPVPCALVAPEGSGLRFRTDLPGAGLAHLAATVLQALGFEPPSDYEPSLLAGPS
ncbi:2,3-bisphosphoglycerate-independent phosphoglycerate mutase [Myxococcota bacterium]|nr:2,3-bisphosphoglycerate-independent phosphoglycerate mutase [Myxococcota bacterium]